MKRIIFTGHISFANRGTEAIIRTLCALVQMNHSDVKFLIPSDNPISDREIWGEDDTVEFFDTKIPLIVRVWAQLTRLPFFQKLIIRLSPKLSLKYRKQIEAADIVFSVGGDMYTFEARFPLWIYLSDKYAQSKNKKTFLIGGTVSEFTNKDHKEILVKHFEGFEQILVRDTASFERLNTSFKAKNVVLTSDSALWLVPQQNSYVDGVFDGFKNDVVKVGINISPLLERLGDTDKVKSVIRRLILSRPQFEFILIPHVFVEGNDDLEYLKVFKNSLGHQCPNLTLIDATLSSRELKYAISKLDIFLGARTHATIAAFSSGVPVVCIAYSDKAFGIARDIYGSAEYVIHFQDFEQGKVEASIDYLLNSGGDLVDNGLCNIDQLKGICNDNLKSLNFS